MGTAGMATRAAMVQHQARRDNMADVAAKDNSQVEWGGGRERGRGGGREGGREGGRGGGREGGRESGVEGGREGGRACS